MKLLVVEDDVPSLELITEVFLSLKADVHSLSNSAEAATLVDHEKFDGIFLDLEMPQPDGFKLAEKVRKSSWNKLTPIVIVTGREQHDSMHKSFSLGATFFLQKPVDRQKLTRLFHTVRGPMAENRRRSARVPLQTKVTCIVGARNLIGRSWNISQGGIQVEVDSLNLNDTVRLSLNLPNSGVAIDATGNVVWARADRQGIQFTKRTPKIQQEIQKFIEEVGSSLD
jgi:CheY-like chemotaxis protein